MGRAAYGRPCGGTLRLGIIQIPLLWRGGAKRRGGCLGGIFGTDILFGRAAGCRPYRCTLLMGRVILLHLWRFGFGNRLTPANRIPLGLAAKRFDAAFGGLPGIFGLGRCRLRTGVLFLNGWLLFQMLHTFDLHRIARELISITAALTQLRQTLPNTPLFADY